MKEEWKLYTETYNARWGKRTYEVSDIGHVKVNGELVDFSKCKSRYYAVGSKYYVHRMVAELFVPNLENKNEVDHINRDSHDNRAVNLRWATHLENMQNKKSSAWNKGLSMSEDFKKSCKEAQLKRFSNLDERKKMSISLSGINHPLYNKHKVYDNKEHTKWHWEIIK